MNTKEKKPIFKRWWFWVIIIIVLIVVASASSSKNDNPSRNKDSGTSSTDKKATEKTEFKIGETATFDKKSITVTDVQCNYDTGNQFAKPESGKEFVVVTVKITNESNSTLDYNTYEFKMQDSNGVQQNESITALAEGKLDSGSLAAGGKVTGKLAYAVPQGDKGLKLLYQSFSFFDNKTITFDLK